MTNTDYTDNLVFLANQTAQAEFLLCSLDQAAGGIDISMNTNKIGFMCLKQEGTISTLSGMPLKLVDIAQQQYLIY